MEFYAILHKGVADTALQSIGQELLHLTGHGFMLLGDHYIQIGYIGGRCGINGDITLFISLLKCLQ